MSNHTHRTIPHAKKENRRLSLWGGGVWQLAVLAAAGVLYVLVTGWGTTDAETSRKQAIVFLTLLALLAAFTFQFLRRARETAEAKARR